MVIRGDVYSHGRRQGSGIPVTYGATLTDPGQPLVEST